MNGFKHFTLDYEKAKQLKCYGHVQRIADKRQPNMCSSGW